MAEENSSAAPAGNATSTDAQSTSVQSTGAPPTGSQAPAAPGGAGVSMSPQQAEARIEELKADPDFRKSIASGSVMAGDRARVNEWHKLHEIAYGKEASAQREQQRQIEQPQEYMVNSDVVGKDSPLIGWMRDLGADQGLVDGVVKLTENLATKGMPTPDQIEAQGAEAVETLVRKYGEDGARDMVERATAMIESMPPRQRDDVKDFLDRTGLGNHPYVVERFALLAQRRAN